jgi:hypothetical protein
LQKVILALHIKMFSTVQNRLFRSSGAPAAESVVDPTTDIGILTAENITQNESKIPEEVVDQIANEDRPNEAAQHGVTVAEAITLSWNKKSLAVAYLL